MRLIHTIVDTLMWLVHGAALYAVLWLLSGHLPDTAVVSLIVLVIIADLAVALPLRRLAQNIQSHTSI